MKARKNNRIIDNNRTEKKLRKLFKNSEKNGSIKTGSDYEIKFGNNVGIKAEIIDRLSNYSKSIAGYIKPVSGIFNLGLSNERYLENNIRVKRDISYFEERTKNFKMKSSNEINLKNFRDIFYLAGQIRNHCGDNTSCYEAIDNQVKDFANYWHESIENSHLDGSEKEPIMLELKKLYTNYVFPRSYVHNIPNGPKVTIYGELSAEEKKTAEKSLDDTYQKFEQFKKDIGFSGDYTDRKVTMHVFKNNLHYDRMAVGSTIFGAIKNSGGTARCNGKKIGCEAFVFKQDNSIYGWEHEFIHTITSDDLGYGYFPLISEGIAEYFDNAKCNIFTYKDLAKNITNKNMPAIEQVINMDRNFPYLHPYSREFIKFIKDNSPNILRDIFNAKENSSKQKEIVKNWAKKWGDARFQSWLINEVKDCEAEEKEATRANETNNQNNSEWQRFKENGIRPTIEELYIEEKSYDDKKIINFFQFLYSDRNNYIAKLDNASQAKLFKITSKITENVLRDIKSGNYKAEWPAANFLNVLFHVFLRLELTLTDDIKMLIKNVIDPLLDNSVRKIIFNSNEMDSNFLHFISTIHAIFDHYQSRLSIGGSIDFFSNLISIDKQNLKLILENKDANYLLTRIFHTASIFLHSRSNNPYHDRAAINRHVKDFVNSASTMIEKHQDKNLGEMLSKHYEEYISRFPETERNFVDKELPTIKDSNPVTNIAIGINANQVATATALLASTIFPALNSTQNNSGIEPKEDDSSLGWGWWTLMGSTATVAFIMMSIAGYRLRKNWRKDGINYESADQMKTMINKITTDPTELKKKIDEMQLEQNLLGSQVHRNQGPSWYSFFTNYLPFSKKSTEENNRINSIV